MPYELIAIWSRLICTVVFFAVLSWIFIKYLKPSLVLAQQARSETIAEAERRRDQAKSKLEEAKHDLVLADRDAIGIIGRAEEYGRHERTRTLTEAEELGKRLVRNAEGELGRARYAARRRLRGEFIEKALDRARTQAQAKVDDSLNARLVDRFAEQLEHGGKN